MKLNDFISETLQDIAHGITDAQKKLEQDKAEINPVINSTPEKSWIGVTDATSGRGYLEIQNIEFEVLLVNEQGGSAEGGLGVFLASIKAGVQGEIKNQTLETTKIKFSIPMTYPAQNTVKRQRY